MRLPLRPRRAARRPKPLGAALLALASLLPLPTHAIDFTPVPSADLDFSGLGRIAIAGDYSGISLYEFEAQVSPSAPANGSAALLAQLPNGDLAPTVPTDATIRAMCVLRSKSGEMRGVVIGGNFTSLNGTRSTAIALYDPATTKLTTIDGLEGEVNALYCDQDRDAVYVGGRFKCADSNNAISWRGSGNWSELPFAGFNGPVKSISKSADGRIIFGGSFTGLGNATSSPSQPDLQTINLSTANITATNSASTSGFGDPKSIVCSRGAGGAGRTWLAQDETSATWEAKFAFGFQPTKLRLWNTRQDGRGTKTFRFMAFPINGIMNFTYVDPASGRWSSCTSECPLSRDTDVEYQDFYFVNRVGMNTFQIAISGWYGKGAGLAGIELFQNDVFTYAVSDFNEPACGSADLRSSSSRTGPWRQSPSMQSNSDYLTAELTGDITTQAASVVFFPNIKESGNYSVDMYTPGCMLDGTCSSRGEVNVTGTMSTGTVNANFTTTIFQTNNYEKYDQIYFGYVEKPSGDFRPSVTLTPVAGQKVGKLTVVAQRVGFNIVNSTVQLNGLFDFDPTQKKTDVSSLMSSAVNKLGAKFGRSAEVSSMVTTGGVTYIGGNFTSGKQSNFVAFSNSQKKAESAGDGLNGQVLDMHLEDAKLYLGGDFNNTRNNSAPGGGLNHVAVYDTNNNSWSALGAGVNGRVELVKAMRVNVSEDAAETVIAFSGKFTECKGFGSNNPAPVDGFAIWVPSRNNWLQNLEGSVPSYNGILTASILDLPGNDVLYAGSMSSSQLGANGAATLTPNGLEKFPADIQPPPAAPGLRRRDGEASSEVPRGVVTGTFYTSGGNNLTIMAGRFTAQAENGTTINNLMFIDGNDNSVSGLGPEVSSDSWFTAVEVRRNILYAGGKVSGTIGGNEVKGIVAYDMDSKSFGNQPAPISGRNGTVAAISVRPGTADVFVGGSFDRAGALDCPGVCLYNADSDQWLQPGTGLAGDVSCLMWSSNQRLIVGGDLVANGSDRLSLAVYDAKKQTWTSFPGVESIPGPVQVMTPASSDGQQIWVAGKSSRDGSVFICKYDGNGWSCVENAPLSSSVLRSLQIFSLTKNHEKTDLLADSQALMVTGSIAVPDVGTVSAAIYNGSHYRPYALTTNTDEGGSISKIFTQRDNFFSTDDGHLPLVFVVLIGLAISLALILLLVLGGIALDRFRKRREGYIPAPTSMYDRGSGMQRIPPRELFGSLSNRREAPQI